MGGHLRRAGPGVPAYARRRAARSSEIRGLPSINRFLESAVDDAETELLTAQPAGPRRAVDPASRRWTATCAPSSAACTCARSTSTPPGAARPPATTSSRILAHGAQVRTLDEFFNRLIVIDRRLAVMPGEAPDVAVAIHDQNLVVLPRRHLRPVLGARAASTTSAAAASESDIAAEVRQMTVRMLTEGHSDPASAKRVGRQHPHLRLLRRRPQGRVRRGDPVPARATR